MPGPESGTVVERRISCLAAARYTPNGSNYRPACWHSIRPTLTPTSPPPSGDLARRSHAKSQRSDLRVVGVAALVSETGHVPLLHRTYPGNRSDQTVLGERLTALGKLHDALDDAEAHPAGIMHFGER
jgi:hypothetical protein